jgi:hypothetical protein
MAIFTIVVYGDEMSDEEADQSHTDMSAFFAALTFLGHQWQAHLSKSYPALTIQVDDELEGIHYPGFTFCRRIHSGRGHWRWEHSPECLAETPYIMP